MVRVQPLDGEEPEKSEDVIQREPLVRAACSAPRPSVFWISPSFRWLFR